MTTRLQKSRIGVLVLLAFGLIIAGGAWIYHVRYSDHFHGVDPLDLATYRTSANSLRGNEYKLEGEVVALLAWSPSGRLLSVGLDEGRSVVPVLLPMDLTSTNIQKGEHFRFLLTVGDHGVLRVKKLVRL